MKRSDGVTRLAVQGGQSVGGSGSSALTVTLTRPTVWLEFFEMLHYFVMAGDRLGPCQLGCDSKACGRRGVEHLTHHQRHVGGGVRTVDALSPGGGPRPYAYSGRCQLPFTRPSQPGQPSGQQDVQRKPMMPTSRKDAETAFVHPGRRRAGTKTKADLAAQVQWSLDNHAKGTDVAKVDLLRSEFQSARDAHAGDFCQKRIK